MNAIKKRLEALEAQAIPDPTFCLVELPDGTQAEKTMEEWYDHRAEWRWLRITKGGDPCSIYLLFAHLDEECGMPDKVERDIEAYERRAW